MNKEELLKLSPGELTDLGICPTCFDRENGGALYGTTRIGCCTKMKILSAFSWEIRGLMVICVFQP